MTWSRAVFVIAIVGSLQAFAAPTAQAEGTWSFGVAGGAALPTGDFGDTFKNGFEGSVHADYGLTDDFKMGFHVGGNFHDATDEFNAAINGATEALLIGSGATGVSSNLETDVSVLRFGIHAKYVWPTGTVTPFVQGGLALYRFNVKLGGSVTANGFTIPSDESDSETKSGVHLGAGVMFSATPNVSLGLGAQYHNVFTEDNASQYVSLAGIMEFGPGGGE